jgi:hypothetical protein
MCSDSWTQGVPNSPSANRFWSRDISIVTGTANSFQLGHKHSPKLFAVARMSLAICYERQAARKAHVCLYGINCKSEVRGYPGNEALRGSVGRGRHYLNAGNAPPQTAKAYRRTMKCVKLFSRRVIPQSKCPRFAHSRNVPIDPSPSVHAAHSALGFSRLRLVPRKGETGRSYLEGGTATWSPPQSALVLQTVEIN